MEKIKTSSKRIKSFVDNNWKIIIVFILICIFLWLFITRDITDEKLYWIDKPYPGGKYGTSNPSERLNNLIKEFGEPDFIDKSKGGFAVWKKNTLQKRGHCWERIEIHDEQVPHKVPVPHTDFLYLWYNLDVPECKVADIRALSDSITYDPLKKLVRARCHAMGPNKATLLLAKRIATGEITIKQAKKRYGPFIFATIKDHKMYNPVAEKSYVKELCDHFKNTKQ